MNNNSDPIISLLNQGNVVKEIEQDLPGGHTIIELDVKDFQLMP